MRRVISSLSRACRGMTMPAIRRCRCRGASFSSCARVVPGQEVKQRGALLVDLVCLADPPARVERLHHGVQRTADQHRVAGAARGGERVVDQRGIGDRLLRLGGPRGRRRQVGRGDRIPVRGQAGGLAPPDDAAARAVSPGGSSRRTGRRWWPRRPGRMPGRRCPRRRPPAAPRPAAGRRPRRLPLRPWPRPRPPADPRRPGPGAHARRPPRSGHGTPAGTGGRRRDGPGSGRAGD